MNDFEEEKINMLAALDNVSTVYWCACQKVGGAIDPAVLDVPPGLLDEDYGIALKAEDYARAGNMTFADALEVFSNVPFL